MMRMAYRGGMRKRTTNAGELLSLHIQLDIILGT
jgi:hypothetical protein